MNFSAVCRTCLSAENLNPIFGESEDHIRYADTIFTTTGVKMAINDGLPQQMCQICINFSNESLKFRKQCKDAETKLLQVKQEHDAVAVNNGTASKDCGEKNLLVVKTEEVNQLNDSVVTIKIEAIDEPEENGSGASGLVEEDPFQLQPVGRAGAMSHTSPGEDSHCHTSLGQGSHCHTSPEEGSHSHTSPREGSQSHTSPQQQPKLSSSFVNLEDHPTEDLHDLVTCMTCLMVFNESSLKSHNCIKPGESHLNVCTGSRYKCDICGEELTKKELLIKHLAAHSAEQSVKVLSYNDHCYTATPKKDVPREFKCSACPKQFALKQTLVRHMRGKHGYSDGKRKVRHKCDVCNKQFRNSHLTHKVHSGEELHICDVCYKQCHVGLDNIHTGEKPLFCSVCSKKFSHPFILSCHMRTHAKKPLFTCNICKKQFTRNDTMKRHKRIHTGEKPHPCDICSKQFVQKSQLEYHLLTHTGSKLHRCEICEKEFLIEIQLMRHLKTHTNEKPFSCDICNKCFRSNGNLSTHKLTHTGEKRHTCSVCSKQFTHKSHLTTHMQMHAGEKLHSCDICMQKFRTKSHLKQHTRVHTGERPYACVVCQERFRHKTTLASHLNRVH